MPHLLQAITVRLADSDDDDALRQLLQTSTMPGEFSLAQRREPSFFAASPVLGHRHQVFVAQARETVIGMAERSERRLYLNGMPATAGYLSGVRILPEHRGGTALFKGFHFLRSLHDQGDASIYLTTIAQENEASRAVLTSGRAGLPTYHRLGPYVTTAIPVRRSVRPVPLADGSVRSAAARDVPALVAFLEAVGSRRQFFPAVTAEDFLGSGRRLAALDLADVLIAERGGRIVGTLARWDQRAYKQWILVRYGWRPRLLRPFFNLAASLFGWPRLPEPGATLSVVFGALAAVRDDDMAVWRALLTELVAREWNRGTAFVAVGLTQDDPMLEQASALWGLRLSADLYLVTFDARGEEVRHQLDGRPYYVELGSL